MGDIPAKHEEIITKTVKVADDEGIDEELFLLHSDAGSFGAATDATNDMGCGDGDMAPGEDKCFHGREQAVHAIDVLLEGFDILLS